MKYLSLALPLVLCCVLAYFGREFDKATRHEFYQVWDTIDEMRGENIEDS